jgi:P27 family predicted phage terminase small subunit
MPDRPEGIHLFPGPGPGITFDVPEPPPEMPGELRDLWDRAVATAKAAGFLTRADGEPLARHAALSHLWWQCFKELETYGRTFYATTKTVVDPQTEKPKEVPVSFHTLPQVGLLREFHALLLEIEKQYGLTPASRPGLGRERSAANKSRFFRAG